jgi:isocitrate dehydrogenase (NAD+)
MHDVAVISGDGIGPEITDAAQRVIEAAGVAIRWHEVQAGEAARARTGEPLPASTLALVRRLGVALKAPLVAGRRTGGLTVAGQSGSRRYPSINSALRRELGLFVNVRPVRGFPALSGRYAAMDVVILREITEDIYIGEEREPAPGCAEAIKRITRAASERLARFACDYALERGRRRITAVHKANVLHLTDGLFLETVRRSVEGHPMLEFTEEAIDAACYLLVKKPERFDILACPNQYGDIVSDLAAGLAGSLGLAPGANLGADAAVFEPAHGAAPDIAGRGRANPVAMVLSSAMLLEHLGERPAAARIRRAVEAVLAAGRDLTPDLGGSATTAELTAALCAAVQAL